MSSTRAVSAMASGGPPLPTGSRSGRRWMLVLLLTGALVGLRRAESPYADGDILWSIRAGRDFLSTGHVPRTDPYSWTAHGKTWVPNSWLWNVVLGLADRVAGLGGVAVLGIAMMAVIALLAGTAARRAGATAQWAALCFQIVAGAFALFMYPRSQIVDYAAVLAVPMMFDSVLRAHGRRLWWLSIGLVFTHVVWMNLHSAAVLGPALIAVFGLGRMVTDREDRGQILRRTVVLTVLCGLACLATPYGWSTITHLAEVRRASAGLISEWRPAGFDSAEQILGVAAILLGLLVAARAARRRQYDTVAVLVLLGVATAFAIRFAPMLVLAATPQMAAAATRLPIRKLLMNAVVPLALSILAIACLAGRAGFAHPGIGNSSSLVADLPRGCRLLNDLGIGGDVILRRPDVPVSIDSRNDMYGRAAELSAIDQLEHPDVGLAFIRSSGVTCVLAQSNAPLVIALREQRDWRVAGTDADRTLLVYSPHGVLGPM